MTSKALFIDKSVASKAPPYAYVTQADRLPSVTQDMRFDGAVALDLEMYNPDALPTANKQSKKAIAECLDRYRSEIRLLQLYREGSDMVWLVDIKALGSTVGGLGFTYLRKALEGKTLIGHNLTTIDAPWARTHLRIKGARLKDTVTAERMLQNGKHIGECDLGETVWRHLKIDMTKGEGASDWNADDLTQAQLDYAAEDVWHLHRLVYKQEEALHRAGLDEVWDLEQRLAPVTVEMMLYGIRFDLTGMDQVKAEADQRLNMSRELVRDWFGMPGLNPNSVGKLIEALKARGIEIPIRYDKKKGVDKETLNKEALRSMRSDIAPLLLIYRGVRDKEVKFIKSSMEHTQKLDGRIHATFNATGTVTGRFSSSKPNMQQIPKTADGRFPLRGQFKPELGNRFIVSDFAQMELVAAAVIADEREMLIELRREGGDLHCKTASFLVGRTITKADEAERKKAKAVNFGLLYGQRSEGLKNYAKSEYNVDMTLEEAELFRAVFFKTYQGLAEWHERANRDARSHSVRSVCTILGRRQLLPDYRRWMSDRDHGNWWHRFTALLNHPVQGSCADTQKMCMIEIANRLRGRARLVHTVHDETVVECAEVLAEEVAREVKAIMRGCSEQMFGIPIPAEVYIADSWSDKSHKVEE